MAEGSANTLLLDGTSDFVGGMDASRAPCRIPDNCYAYGVNVTVKQGILQPRWGIDQFSVNYPDGGVYTRYKKHRTYREIFEAGKYQAAVYYYVGRTLYVVLVISGHIFAYNADSHDLIPIPITDGSIINPRAARINRETAGRYLVFHDFPNYPVIVEGLTARRAKESKMEIPVSTIGAFNENRLFIANAGNDFTGGDPVGSAAAPNAPITFKEFMTPGSPYYLEGYQLPTENHNAPITYMGFLAMSDTSTGIGPLVIGTSLGIYTFATNTSRSAWLTQQFGSTFCYNAGVVGPRAFVNTNSDAFFLSNDGYARMVSVSRDEQHAWARVPVSREAEPLFKACDKTLRPLMQYAFAGAFNNKVFFSVNPYRMPVTDFESGWPISDYAFGGLAVIGLDNMTAFGQAGKPVWEGLWTGVRPMDMVVTDEGTRAFIIGKDGAGVNRIYELNPDTTHDTADNHLRYVRSRIRTKEYEFQNPFLNKELDALLLNLDEIKGDFKLEVKYKPAHSATFIPWATITHDAPWRMCSELPGCFLNGYAGHNIRDLMIPAPDDSLGSPLTDDLYKVGRKFQLQLTFSGKYWELDEMQLRAALRPQPHNVLNCSSRQNVPICKECSDDWHVEPFSNCKETVT